MKDIFKFHDRVIENFTLFSRSFTKIKASDIEKAVDDGYNQGKYWPPELIQINPNYKKASTLGDLVKSGELHPLCGDIFEGVYLYQHQQEALAIAQQGEPYVVTTGTGSGKSLAFFLPIIDHVLKAKEQDAKPKTKAIIIYPMNALANSQMEELEKYISRFEKSSRPFTFARYTGQEDNTARESIANNPPDILLTNYMMLELLLTRYNEIDRKVIVHCEGLEYLVLDELHTYRGRQGADVAMLVRRVRQHFHAEKLICIGTSATMKSIQEGEGDNNTEIAEFASLLFGQKVDAQNVVGETLEQVTDPGISAKDLVPLLQQKMQQNLGYSLNNIDVKKDPLAIWIELNMGINKETMPPKKIKPVSLKSAAEKLAADTRIVVDKANNVLQRFFLSSQDVKDEKGKQLFPFKLHQFISGAGKVMCTLQRRDKRYITLDAQRFSPTNNEIFLYSVYFCRECGQEFIPVEFADGRWTPREIDSPISKEMEATSGFLVPFDPDLDYSGDEDLPDFWFEEFHGNLRIASLYKKHVPVQKEIDEYGTEGAGHSWWYIPGHIPFCPHWAYLADRNYWSRTRRIYHLSSSQ
jgi:hypothetical protein